jgi:hypothetical protein
MLVVGHGGRYRGREGAEPVRSEEDEVADESDPSVSRRALLRRGAVVGGIAWTAPIIVQSLASPAGAQVSPAPPPPDRDDDDDDDDRDPPQAAPNPPIIEPVPPPPIVSDITFTG